MRSKLRQLGTLALVILAGAVISFNFPVLAQPASAGTAADRRAARVYRSVRAHQERLRRIGRRQEAHRAGHFRHARGARPALGLSRQGRVSRNAGRHARRVRRPRHRGRHGRRIGQSRVAHRRYAGIAGRHQIGRSDRQARRCFRQRHDVERRGQADARQARHARSRSRLRARAKTSRWFSRSSVR